MLAADPTIPSLLELAKTLACSPSYLSRVFHEHTGHTIAAHRTELRVNMALEMLADANHRSSSLSEIATLCGFADHAHLTRTLRRRLGMHPTSLRALTKAD
jgi:transcriptional regulator GlxA family with amidase domain